MKNSIIRPFKSWTYFIAANALLSFVIIFLFWPSIFSAWQDFLAGFFWSFCFSLSQWLGNTYVALKIDEYIDEIERPIARTIYGALGLLIYSSLAYIVVHALMSFVFFGHDFPDNPLQWFWGLLTFILPVSAGVSIVFSGIGYYLRWRQTEIKAQKLETEMLRYKYESLKNQINPHFLFNSFNVLSDMVEEEPKKAVQFIHKMSNLYRYVLDSKSKELVPLDEEMQFIDVYIYLLKSRFGEKFIVDISLEKMNGYMIVPMAIQLLVENVVKHNMATKAKPLKLEIKQEGSRMLVKNNLQLRKSQTYNSNKGLENLRQQFSFFTKEEVLILQNEHSFEVSIPLLTKI